MSHDIHEFSDGSATLAFAGSRNGIWHRLGQELPPGCTLDEAFELAKLTGWEIVYRPLEFRGPDGRMHFPLNTFVPWRTDLETGERVVIGASMENPDRPALVSGQYNGWTVEEFKSWVLEVVGALTDAGATVSTAGGLGNFSKVFCSFDMQSIRIAGESFEPYLSFLTGFAGNAATQAWTGGVRPVCQNTVTWGISAAKHEYTVRHTASMHERLDEVRNALGLANAYQEALKVQLEKLALTPFHKWDATLAIDRLYAPKGDIDQWTKRQINAHERMREELMRVVFHSKTTENHRGTALGFLEGVTEYNEWIKPRQSKDDQKRAWGVFAGNVAERNQKVFDYLVESFA